MSIHFVPEVEPEVVCIASFHGTASDFDRFDESSVGRGTETEPNNRLGVFLTQCPFEAQTYAENCAGYEPESAKVLAVVFTGRLAPSFFSQQDIFVSGDLHDCMEDHVISDHFREAHALASATAEETGEDADVDACQVFSAIRDDLRQEFDALWIESGEIPYLCVLNPDCLHIAATLTSDQIKILGDDESFEFHHFGQEGPQDAKNAIDMIKSFFPDVVMNPEAAPRSRIRP